jgi:hypothetical protein
MIILTALYSSPMAFGTGVAFGTVMISWMWLVLEWCRRLDFDLFVFPKYLYLFPHTMLAHIYVCPEAA